MTFSNFPSLRLGLKTVHKFLTMAFFSVSSFSNTANISSKVEARMEHGEGLGLPDPRPLAEGTAN